MGESAVAAKDAGRVRLRSVTVKAPVVSLDRPGGDNALGVTWLLLDPAISAH